jgi:hypothetical protein
MERSISPCGRVRGEDIETGRGRDREADLAQDEGVVGNNDPTLPFAKLVDKLTEILRHDSDDKGEDDHASDGHHEADHSLHEPCVVSVCAWVCKKGPRYPK